MKNDKLDVRKVAGALGAEHRGSVTADSGYFGAVQLASDVVQRFRAPQTGGRATDPSWTERRLIPLAPQTLDTLERIAAITGESTGIPTAPLQVAAILLEQAVAAQHDLPLEQSCRIITFSPEVSFPSTTKRAQNARSEALAAQIRERHSVFANLF
jgi:hypothetical protein